MWQKPRGDVLYLKIEVTDKGGYPDAVFAALLSNCKFQLKSESCDKLGQIPVSLQEWQPLAARRIPFMIGGSRGTYPQKLEKELL